MEFYEWKSFHDRLKGQTGMQPAEFYRFALAVPQFRRWNPLNVSHAEIERHWYADRRPYYKVYPSIIPMLIRLNLDLPGDLIRPPMRALSIRLPRVQHALGSLRGVLLAEKEIERIRHFEFVVDVGERDSDGERVTRFFRLPRTDMTLEALLLDSLDDPTMIPIIKLVCTICLLADDPDLIEPDVLAVDRKRFERTFDPKYVKKARRQGKIGWNIGRRVETIPHYRRPHLALFWTGPGRTVPKIGPRKGSIVKRSTIGNMPTGYLDDEE